MNNEENPATSVTFGIEQSGEHSTAKQAMKIVEGDDVAGDKHQVAGTQVQGNVEGGIDASGQVNTVTNERNAADPFNHALREEAQKMEDKESLGGVVEHEFPTLPEELVQAAKENAAELVDSSVEEEAEVASMTPLTFATAFEVETMKPEEEQSPGKLSAMVRGAKRFGPLLLNSALAAGEAFMKSKVQTSPWVAAGLAAVSVARGQ